MIINRSLLEKYNQSGPRYTSYPPATFFSETFGVQSFVEQLQYSNSQSPQAISLYIHIPFCKKLCHFCGCNSISKPTNSVIDSYVHALCREIEMTALHIAKNREVMQIHWGGGTPHSIPLSQISHIMSVVKNNFTISSNAEIAMECNPAYTDFSFFEELRTIGFNRISLGIQDFDIEILKIVNRDASQIPPAQLVQHIKQLGFGINLDLIYGLPGQTLQSFETNLETVCTLQPHRLVTFSYAHVPWVKKAQKILERYQLPDADTKLSMLESANRILNAAGYISIGFDHFALPNDELAIAVENKQLHRNFQGYCTKQTTGQVYAFGTSAISQFAGSYFQNTKDIETYIATISQQTFATEKGYILDHTDCIVRDVITELMCNQYVDFNAIAWHHAITKDELYTQLHIQTNHFDTFITDNLVRFTKNVLHVLPQGTFFLRNIAMSLDPKLGDKQATYSKTI